MNRQNFRIAALAALLLTVLAGQAPGATYYATVTPEGDAVFNHSHGGGYSANWWTVDASPNSAYYWYYGPPAEVGYTNAFLQFSLADLPASDHVLSAYLYIDLLGINNGYGEDIGAATINHRSDSTGANGNANQGYGGDQFVAKIATQSLGLVSFDVTSYLQSDQASGYDWSAFSVNFTANGYGGSGMSFGSSESGSPAYLRIVTDGVVSTPEPGSAALLALGAAGLAFIRRRTSRSS